MFSDTDRIAGEPHRLLFRNRDPFPGGDAIPNRGLPVAVERARKPEHLASGQRAKTGIQVVEPPVQALHRPGIYSPEHSHAAGSPGVGPPGVAVETPLT